MTPGKKPHKPASSQAGCVLLSACYPRGLKQEQKHQQTFGFWLDIKAQTVTELLELCGFSPGWKAGQASRTEGRV